MFPLGQGDRVLDVGSGGGFDAFVAAKLVGDEGHIVGVDMTPQMLQRSRATAQQLGFDHVEFREGIAEELPLEDGSVDVVISNGVLNLMADKASVFAEIDRVLRPGGRLQFADIAIGMEVPGEARCNVDLWTDCIAGALSMDDWRATMEQAGFTDLEVGPSVDTFDGAAGEPNARSFEVYGYPFLARRPG